MDYIQKITKAGCNPAEISAVEDYQILGQWSNEYRSKDDAEAWEQLWGWFKRSDNKATLAFGVICRIGDR